MAPVATEPATTAAIMVLMGFMRTSCRYVSVLCLKSGEMIGPWVDTVKPVMQLDRFHRNDSTRFHTVCQCPVVVLLLFLFKQIVGKQWIKVPLIWKCQHWFSLYRVQVNTAVKVCVLSCSV